MVSVKISALSPNKTGEEISSTRLCALDLFMLSAKKKGIRKKNILYVFDKLTPVSNIILGSLNNQVNR